MEIHLNVTTAYQTIYKDMAEDSSRRPNGRKAVGSECWVHISPGLLFICLTSVCHL